MVENDLINCGDLCEEKREVTYRSFSMRSSLGIPFHTATFERMSLSVPGAISSWRGIVIACSPAGVVH